MFKNKMVEYSVKARWWVDKFIYTVDDYVGKNRKSIGFHPYYKFKIVGDGGYYNCSKSLKLEKK